ncbi:hypothetical protein [Flyfo microvirus Tbat2_144]|nr:hypothetical protein [Flyfo microvirus Tbat2_144]
MARIREETHDPVTGEVYDHKGRRLTPGGAEIPDPTVIAPPIGTIRQPPLHELIRQMIRSEQLAQYAENQEADTFEEADDFDVEDDDTIDPTSPYEEQFEPVQPPPAAGPVREAETAAVATQPSPEAPSEQVPT